LAVLFSSEEFEKLKEALVFYNCALMNVRTRIDILLEYYTNLRSYNPIEHVKNRLKSPERIAEKLQRRGFDITSECAVKNLTDIAGIRCICSYNRDIFQMVAILKRQPDIKIIGEKDYVSNPKPSGYRSYHMILEVPVYLSETTEYIPVELQLRTQAMDFWASLEHKVKYKYNDQMPETLLKALLSCANEIDDLDAKMFNIQEVADLTRQEPMQLPNT